MDCLSLGTGRPSRRSPRRFTNPQEGDFVDETVGLKVLFVAGFGPLVRDSAASKALYVDTLQLPLEARPDIGITFTPWLR
jgi:hypothetical protein